jgi:hypothetical protein
MPGGDVLERKEKLEKTCMLNLYKKAVATYGHSTSYIESLI